MGSINNFYAYAVIIMNKDGKIIYSNVYHDSFQRKQQPCETCQNNNGNILELYPDLKHSRNTLSSYLKNGRLTFKKKQVLKDYKGKQIEINSLNIPIIHGREIIGVVSLIQHCNGISNFDRDDVRKSVNILDYTTHCEFPAPIYNFNDIITNNEDMLQNIERAKVISNKVSSILIYGETGTGKELFASAIHNHSSRRGKPFIVQNCAAIPETLIESLFFGTTKGAFTGAIDKPGLFESANQGTLFLDEIHSMPVNLQAKLLRVLQDGIIRRVGSSKERKVDVRIITAMNIDPLKAVKEGSLRRDLFYRLNVASLKLIPLRERKKDIPLYVEHFIRYYNHKFSKKVVGVTNKVKELFEAYDWPGNVREIQHAIEASVAVAGHGKIDIRHLPVYLIEKIDSPKEAGSIEKEAVKKAIETTQPLRDTIENFERSIIIKVLEKAGGNVSQAADKLKITRQSLHYKLNKYNITCRRY
ncbi:MAG: sigma 54-interacting transcriptional regulator [Firmicutes bacterium]|nr:sigma 54-interacting transcriptional regulator [Bacillota bacterium]